MPVKIENNPTACFMGSGFGSIVWNIKALKLIKVICEHPLIIVNIEIFLNILCSVILSTVPFSCCKSDFLMIFLDLSVRGREGNSRTFYIA